MRIAAMPAGLSAVPRAWRREAMMYFSLHAARIGMQSPSVASQSKVRSAICTYPDNSSCSKPPLRADIKSCRRFFFAANHF
jgi:hypothetical protein